MSIEKKEAAHKELERLLELKKMRILNEIESQEKMRLEMRYKKYMSLTAKEMEEQLSHTNILNGTNHSTVKSSFCEQIINDYINLFENELFYPEEPEITEDNKCTLTFSDFNTSADFFLLQASKNVSFLIIDDESKKVAFYSTGDGTMYHGDGTVFYKGDQKKLSELDVEEFINNTDVGQKFTSHLDYYRYTP